MNDHFSQTEKGTCEQALHQHHQRVSNCAAKISHHIALQM